MFPQGRSNLQRSTSPLLIDLTLPSPKPPLIDLTCEDEQFVLNSQNLNNPSLENDEESVQILYFHFTSNKNCKSSYSVKKNSSAASHSDLGTDSSQKEICCNVCLEDDLVIHSTNRHLMATHCGHIFCSSCIDAVIKTHHACPVCRKKLKKNSVHKLFL